VHALNATENILLWISEGGISVGYLNGTTLSTWGRRFMNPTVVYLDATDAHISALNFSSAIQFDGSVFVYLSRESGTVMGVERKSDWMWSDTFEPVPADLSTFKIANAAIAPNGNLHLCGQFQRIDDKQSFSSSHVYCLDLWSGNGKVFSLDRFTLFAQEDTSVTIGNDFGLRYQIAFKEGSDYDRVYFSDAGKVMSDTAPYWIGSTRSEHLVIPGHEIKKLSGDLASQYMLVLSNNEEYYLDHPLVKVGNLAILEIGAKTGSDYEFYQSGQCIIASLGTDISDGVRRSTVGIVPESLWKAANMTHPFYLEIQSKQSLNDDMDEFDNLYDVSEDGTLPTQLAVDFWVEGELGNDWHNAGAVHDYTSADLKELGYDDYPVIEALPFTLEAYGWSRAGGNSHYEGGGDDPADSASPNDNVTGFLVIEREEVQSTVYLTNITGNGYWPQTWDTGAHGRGTGALPVIINARTEDGLAIGDKIIKVGARLTNPSTTDESTFYCERVELPAIMARLPQPVIETWRDVDFWPPGGCQLEFVQMDVCGSEGVIEGDHVGEFTTLNLGCSDEHHAWKSIGYLLHAPWILEHGNRWQDHPDQYGVLIFNITMIENLHLDHPNGSIKFAYPGDEGYFPGLTRDHDAAGNFTYDGETKDIETITSSSENTVDYNLRDGIYFEIVSDFHASHRWRINSITARSWNNALPDVVLWTFDGSQCPEAPPVNRIAKELQKIGVPKILFATKPYSTFNFSVATQVSLTGENAWGGCVGLGKDGSNYIVARASGDGVLEVAKVVNDTKVTLAATTYTTSDTIWLLFEHRDGFFRVFIKDIADTAWPTTPNLTYTWEEVDGVMSQDGDLMHVGVYALRDAPYVRICGFSLPNGQTYLGVMPPAENFSRMPASGTLNIDGIEYTYMSLVAAPTPIRGPFQGRNSSSGWSYTSDGESYSGYAVEFTNFEWLTNSSNHDKYSGHILNYDSGFGWLLQTTDWKPTIRTSGVTVNLRNRSRNFVASDIGDNAGWSTKMWITGGFAGMAVAEGEGETVSAGTLAFLVSDTKVVLSGFAASSGHEDATVEDLIDKLLRLCGGSASFPGDTVVSSHTLGVTEWTVA
jgi:hypothetical protein